MSLKHFHIFFISVSILLTLGFAGWCFFLAPENSLSTTVMGIGSVAIAIALLVYERWFLSMQRQMENRRP